MISNKNKLYNKINWLFNLEPNTILKKKLVNKNALSNESAILIHLKKKKSKLVNMLFIDAFTSAWEDKKNGFD